MEKRHCLYTKRLVQKQKKWQEGHIHFDRSTGKVSVRSDDGEAILSTHLKAPDISQWKEDDEVKLEDAFLVQIGSLLGGGGGGLLAPSSSFINQQPPPPPVLGNAAKRCFKQQPQSTGGPLRGGIGERPPPASGSAAINPSRFTSPVVNSSSSSARGLVPPSSFPSATPSPSSLPGGGRGGSTWLVPVRSQSQAGGGRGGMSSSTSASPQQGGEGLGRGGTSVGFRGAESSSAAGGGIGSGVVECSGGGRGAVPGASLSMSAMMRGGFANSKGGMIGRVAPMVFKSSPTAIEFLTPAIRAGLSPVRHVQLPRFYPSSSQYFQSMAHALCEEANLSLSETAGRFIQALQSKIGAGDQRGKGVGRGEGGGPSASASNTTSASPAMTMMRRFGVLYYDDVEFIISRKKRKAAAPTREEEEEKDDDNGWASRSKRGGRRGGGRGSGKGGSNSRWRGGGSSYSYYSSNSEPIKSRYFLKLKNLPASMVREDFQKGNLWVVSSRSDMASGPQHLLQSLWHGPSSDGMMEVEVVQGSNAPAASTICGGGGPFINTTTTYNAIKCLNIQLLLETRALLRHPPRSLTQSPLMPYLLDPSKIPPPREQPASGGFMGFSALLDGDGKGGEGLSTSIQGGVSNSHSNSNADEHEAKAKEGEGEEEDDDGWGSTTTVSWSLPPPPPSSAPPAFAPPLASTSSLSRFQQTSNQVENEHEEGWSIPSPLLYQVAQEVLTHVGGLNEDQMKVMQAVLDWFDPTCPEPPPPILLVHGVFGSGKSHLLFTLCLLLDRIAKILRPDDDEVEGAGEEEGDEEGEGYHSNRFHHQHQQQQRSGPSLTVPPSSSCSSPLRVLVSASTNVAVDRILGQLQEIGYNNMIRVGSSKRVQPSLLPYLFQANDGESVNTASISLDQASPTRQVRRLRSARIVGVTCHSCPTLQGITEVDPKKYGFPIVIMDEASQVPEPISLLPIIAAGNAKRLILVGDPKQLPPQLAFVASSSPAASAPSQQQRGGGRGQGGLSTSLATGGGAIRRGGGLSQSTSISEAEGGRGVDPDSSLERPMFVRLASTATAAGAACSVSRKDGLEPILLRTQYSGLRNDGLEETLPRTQYRCHPTLSRLASDLFYGGQLRDGITPEDRKAVVGNLPPLVWVDCVQGREQQVGGDTFMNYQEAQMVLQVLGYLLATAAPEEKGEDGEGGGSRVSGARRVLSPEDIGVIVPYKAQAAMITKGLKEKGMAAGHVKVSTVDAFQGAEREVIIYSCCRTNGLGFLDSPHRLNVAITRARRHLIVLGKAQALLMMERGHRMWSTIIHRSQMCQHPVELASTWMT